MANALDLELVKRMDEALVEFREDERVKGERKKENRGYYIRDCIGGIVIFV